MSLLEFFDPKKYNLEEVSNVLEKVITTVKEKGGEHQAGCAWIIMILYKRGKCNTLQIDDLIDEFNEWMKDLDEFLNSFENPKDKTELIFIYYNGFLSKKAKGS